MPVKKKTLAIVQYASFRSFPVGGISIFLESVLPHLTDIFELKLIGMSRGERIGQWARIQIDGRDYDFLPVVSDRKSSFLPDRVRLAWAMLRHRDAITAAAADAYYVHMTEAALGLMLATRKPVVVHVHGLYNLFKFSRFSVGRMQLFPWIYETCYPALLSRCAKVLGTGSESEYKAFCEMMAIKSGARIPTCSRDNIFFPRNRQEVRTRFGIAANDRVVLFAGRMMPVKNIPLLLEAVRRVGREVTGLKVVLVGDGPARAEAEQIAASMDNVRFLGMLSADELSEWMNAADLLALTSRIEGFPTTVIEALSCGLPAVVTPVSAAYELIHDAKDGVLRNGVIAGDFSVEAYARALMEALMHMPERSTCVASVERYRPALVARQIIREIDAVIDQPNLITEEVRAH